MHRCFNNLEIFPALNPRRQPGGSFFNLPGDRQLSQENAMEFQIGKPQKMKSSKEFDKYGPPAKVWSSFVTRTALHE